MSQLVMTAHVYKKDFDPTGWWVSEKWDGYRAVWNGNTFLSRTGKVFNAPEWFKQKMPKNINLDGELWIGRGKYEQCGLFRKKIPNDEEWKELKVRYNVFDTLSHLSEPFEKRMNLLKKYVEETDEKVLVFTPQTKVTSRDEVDFFYNDVISKGGEGVMLRKPGSMYAFKRSKTLLKYKVSLDTECKIVGYKEGTGKYSGMLGSFKCVLLEDESISFYVSGMSDAIRENYEETHPVGTVITITYNEKTKNGIPRHPRYLRIK